MIPKRMNNILHNSSSISSSSNKICTETSHDNKQSNPIMILLNVTKRNFSLFREGLACAVDNTTNNYPQRTKQGEDNDSRSNSPPPKDSILIYYRISRRRSSKQKTATTQEEEKYAEQSDDDISKPFDAATIHDDGVSINMQNPNKKKQVRFQDISIKVYAVTVGCRSLHSTPRNSKDSSCSRASPTNVDYDHNKKVSYICSSNISCMNNNNNTKSPKVTTAYDIPCPIELSWQHTPAKIISLDDYEKQKDFKITNTTIHGNHSKKIEVTATNHKINKKNKCRKLSVIERRQRIANVNNINLRDVYELEDKNQDYNIYQMNHIINNKKKISPLKISTSSLNNMIHKPTSISSCISSSTSTISPSSSSPSSIICCNNNNNKHQEKSIHKKKDVLER